MGYTDYDPKERFGKPSPPFPVTMPHGNLRQLLAESGGFSYEDSEIKNQDTVWNHATPDFPPNPDYGPPQVELSFWTIGEEKTVAQVQKDLDAYNEWAKRQQPSQPTYALANVKHLLGYRAMTKDAPVNFTVIAGGSSTALGGRPCIPYLSEFGGGRGLSLLFADVGWFPRSRFLLVRTS